MVPDQLHGEWKVVCDECGVAMHPGAVTRHKKSFHRGGDEVVMGRFNCKPPCTFSCARAEHLKQHQKPNNKLCMLNASICTSCLELVRGSMLTHRRSKCSAKYPCLECDAAFPTKALLIDHRSDAHPDRLVVLSAQWVFLVLYLTFMVLLKDIFLNCYKWHSTPGPECANQVLHQKFVSLWLFNMCPFD